MNIRITPSSLKGSVTIPSSKSYSHRMIIGAALAKGTSVISNINESEDIKATCEAVTAIGADIKKDGSSYEITGISEPSEKTVINCRESGSTLRFILPIAAAFGCDTEFHGYGKLPERPLTPYIREMSVKGINFTREEGKMPFYINGTLQAGTYRLEGDISSQFVTGLLYALPLCAGSSVIKMTSALESKPYADMTAEALKRFGIEITQTYGEDGFINYVIKGRQKYVHSNISVEGDYSQAAFFYTANALGSDIDLHNLNCDSVQGDKKILEILNGIGYNKNCGSKFSPFNLDVSDIPDLVPILAVLGCFTAGTSYIYNAKRLRIKECDRLSAIADALNSIGGNIKVYDDSLEINPVNNFTGGTIDGRNDHRIVMASAIASVKASDDIIITGAEAVEKSYPDFWNVFSELGGIIKYL